MTRKILHLDLDAFFCAVEENLNPDLRGTAFAVGGKPNQRGVVSSYTYAARRFGIRSAMPMSTAVRLCPNLIIVPPNFKAYHEASKRVMDRLFDLTPIVEQLSVDEAFLDVSFLAQTAETVARQLQALINRELALPCSIGVASNKLTAKIANNIGKASSKKDGPPNAITFVPAGGEAIFLAPLPVHELWGVGPKTAEKLAQMGIRTISELARWPEKDLIYRFGKHGQDLWRHAQGIDDRPVETVREAKSISKEITFTHDAADIDTLKRTLRRLSDGVGRQVRKAELNGTTIRLKLRWTDFTTLTRQTTLDHPTNQDNEIYSAAVRLFEQNWQVGRPVRLIGVGISSFDDPHRQLGLWDAPQNQEESALQKTLDSLRDRFGEEILKRGSDLRDDE